MEKAKMDTKPLAKDSEVLLEMEPQSRHEQKNSGSDIHYVLVYERCEETENKNEYTKAFAADHEAKREKFEKEIGERLKIEKETLELPGEPSKIRQFVKIHLPLEVMLDEAEDLKLKAPLGIDQEVKSGIQKMLGEGVMTRFKNIDPLIVRNSSIQKETKYYMGTFIKDKIHRFADRKPEDLFTENDWKFVAQKLCFDAGLRTLLSEGVYSCSYAPHDGDDCVKEGESPSNDRQRLHTEWARFGRSFKYQPYKCIKNYFGTEIGLYFAWLGFYTAMLVPLAIAGLIVFIYGLATASSNPVVMDSCNKSLENYFYMCPLCDRQCSYWDLVATTCNYAIVTHFFDNELTVLLAILSSIWATLFLEFWKRKQLALAIEWNVAGFEKDEEPLRPEFARTAPTLKKNPITGQMEPHVPRMTRYRKYGVAGSIVAMMILLVVAAVVGVVIYRAAVFAALSGNKILSVRRRARTVTSITAALINLVCINLLKFIYNKIALWLTKWENPRTRTDFEDSFTYKMYLFQFVNTYASIFYIAFFKSGIVIGTPGRYKRVASKYRLDGCSEQGCFLELCIQLFIIMVGQQIIGNITEIAIPALMEWLKIRKRPKSNKELPQYQQDYDLNDLGNHYMFWEYLEVVLQYGFVTMFVSAFPLAPLFALLNSIVEIRVDAINFVRQYRRPDIAIAEDIGAWFQILEGLTKLSVLINAFVLSFTSDFVPRLLYKMKYAPDRDDGRGTLHGYLNNSLSFFDVEYFDKLEPGTKPDDPLQNLNYTRSFCRYSGYHYNTQPFKFSKQYWHVIAARLAFVFVFQFTVYSITNFIAYVIPDKSRSSQIKLKMEKILAKDKLSAKRKATDDFQTNTLL